MSKKGFFEGWYLKHCNKGEVFSLIPGMHCNDRGKKSAFIQVVMKDKSYYVPYEENDFYADPERFYVIVGKNIFTKEGIQISIQRPDLGLALEGKIRYGKLSPLHFNIMGPFRFLPGMECSHGVLSMEHGLMGNVTYNGSYLEFTGGKGYMEKDMGKSFPEEYVWSQCNVFSEKRISIMAAAATIPYMGMKFTGCISVIRIGKEEYRLTTWHGARVTRLKGDQYEIRQRDYRLHILLRKSGEHALYAPEKGDMSRTIYEDLVGTVEYKFYHKNQLKLHEISEYASYEYSKNS